MRVYYVSCPWCTVRVGVSGRIVDTAPVVGRFVGQRFEELTRWLGADVVEEITIDYEGHTSRVSTP